MNLNFTAASTRSYTIKGNGTFQIGGEVALVQQMELELEISDGVATKVCHLKNPSPAVTGRWPMINLTLEQTDGTLTQNYTLHLAAAPLREIWFSTALTRWRGGLIMNRSIWSMPFIRRPSLPTR